MKSVILEITPALVQLMRLRPMIPCMLIVIHTVPILLAIFLLNKYFFKSAEGIDGAING